MSQGRRTIDRRRRVLYSAAADTGPSTVASRREQARLREARSPATTYGSRVHRGLRGRWFGLVPVRRRTMLVATGTVAAIALVLCAFHYMAVAWPSIANQGDIARPLRLDRPDSFGRWFAGILMLGSAGASYLIYQLRRHRRDDFRGHYRLWLLVLTVMILASLNSVVSLVDWSGALLDAAIGKRVALEGADWIRIVVSLGGAVLALRLIAEVRRSRAALIAMLAAASFLAIPEAAKWNVLEVETIGRWALVTSAPLLAFTSLFLAFGIYLRMLYREVRRFDESDRLKDRLQQMRLRVFQRSVVDDRSEEQEQPEPVAQLVKSRAAESDENSEPNPQRRWFGLRAAKVKSDTDGAENTLKESDDQPPASKKKRRFSLRLKSPASAAVDSKPEQQPASKESDEPKPKRKFGLGGFRRQPADEVAVNDQTAEQDTASHRTANSSTGDYIDPDGIDWNGLSKAERRRLRKQLKRQNRAA